MSKIVSLRVSERDHELWKRASGTASFNGWANRALNDAAAARLNERHLERAQEKLAERAVVLERMGGKRTFEPDFK